jgi:hypothetical protein
LAKSTTIQYKSGIQDITRDAEGKKLAYRNNSSFRAAGTPIDLTAEHIEEYKKCYNDIIYFVENYVVIMKRGEGLGIIKPDEWQKKLLKDLTTNNRTCVLCPRQSGKCLTYKSKIKIKNKKTGKERYISIGRFYIEQKIKSVLKSFLLKLNKFFNT